MEQLTFTWEQGTAKNNMYTAVKERGLVYRFDYFFNLCVDLGEGLAPVTYFLISDEDKLYGITYKPERTIDFFKISGDELYAEDSKGISLEEKMCKELHPTAEPFFSTLKEALDHCGQLKEEGYEAKILERMDNSYAVIVK